MILLAIKTLLLKKGDNLPSFIQGSIKDGDIVVVSSKAIATIEGAALDLARITPSKEANEWSAKTGRSAAFMEATLVEMKRLHGKIVGHCSGAVLTEVKPEGLSSGTILTANAGLDESNVKKNHAIGWPKDPVQSAIRLQTELGNVAVIITDSCCRPRRLGVTAFALVVAGFDPLVSLKNGTEDLFGKSMRITTEAVADQLATAANFLMGNAAQSTPIVIIREHGIAFSDYKGWVPGIEPEEDLFKGII